MSAEPSGPVVETLSQPCTATSHRGEKHRRYLYSTQTEDNGAHPSACA